MSRSDTVARLLIRGRVQGVGYRAWCVRAARSLALRGWVRNLTDGSVEVLACGSEEAIGALVAAAHDGPSSAKVTDVHRADLEPSSAHSLGPDFHEAPTAPPQA
jgi:acylphosphatase